VFTDQYLNSILMSAKALHLDEEGFSIDFKSIEDKFLALKHLLMVCWPTSDPRHKVVASLASLNLPQKTKLFDEKLYCRYPEYCNYFIDYHDIQLAIVVERPTGHVTHRVSFLLQ
jgi:hypothetical protein